MLLFMIDGASLAAEGFAALKRGEPAAARELLMRLVQTGGADAAAWFGLAMAYRQLDSPAEESHALDQALKLDAQYFPAIIGKGDLFARQRDDRAASVHYAAAIRLANSLTSLPEEWRRELDRIETIRQRINSNFEAHLANVLAAQGLGELGTERVSRALDLVLGKRQIFLQQPTNFYFPELPQIEFYHRRDFPWVEALEMQTAHIRSEAQAVLEGAGWVPYIETKTRYPTTYGNPLLQDPSWSAFYLIKDGNEVQLNAQRCPTTMAALRELPLCRTGRTPSVLFSLLRPLTRIRPHHGFMNTRLICHLPLIIPDKCALRVGNESREWREGQVVLFDDSVEHEAWNMSEELRVVMIFDVWRPELSEKERALVAAMLAAVDQFDRHRQGA